MGPFRTPAPMPRAPIPPYGHGEWHPRAELLNALDEYDAVTLTRLLKLARTSFWSAFTVGAAYITHALFALVHAANGALIEAVVGMAVAAGWWWVSRWIYRDALRLRDSAYHEAERALEAKLNRDPRPRALQLITNNDEIGGAA